MENQTIVRPPEFIIVAGPDAGIRNLFELYMPLADEWGVYTNRSREVTVLVAHGGMRQATIVEEITLWGQISKGATMNNDRVREPAAAYGRDWKAQEQRVQQAVRKAILAHKKAGNPIAEWRDGRVVWTPPEEIDIEEE